jgi:hypothetical protein
MGTMLFSSGTSGGKKKVIICNNGDLKRQRIAMSHFWDDCPSKGIVVNTLPAYPNLGYHFAKMYEEFCNYPIVNTGGLLQDYKLFNLISELNPYLVIGQNVDIKKIIELVKGIKIVVIANGCPKQDRKYYKSLGIEVRMTYGLSEAKMAWLSDKELEGYLVYKDSDCHFTVENDELVLFSPDYPNGYYTGDCGTIICETDDYQKIGIDINRKDGITKEQVIGCGAGL